MTKGTIEFTKEQAENFTCGHGYLQGARLPPCPRCVTPFHEAAAPAQPIATPGYVQEVRPDDPAPSCHVCGAQMVPDGFKCLSCKATTKPAQPVPPIRAQYPEDWKSASSPAPVLTQPSAERIPLAWQIKSGRRIYLFAKEPKVEPVYEYGGQQIGAISFDEYEAERPVLPNYAAIQEFVAAELGHANTTVVSCIQKWEMRARASSPAVAPAKEKRVVNGNLIKVWQDEETNVWCAKFLSRIDSGETAEIAIERLQRCTLLQAKMFAGEISINDDGTWRAAPAVAGRTQGDDPNKRDSAFDAEWAKVSNVEPGVLNANKAICRVWFNNGYWAALRESAREAPSKPEVAIQAFIKTRLGECNSIKSGHNISHVYIPNECVEWCPLDELKRVRETSPEAPDVSKNIDYEICPKCGGSNCICTGIIMPAKKKSAAPDVSEEK